MNRRAIGEYKGKVTSFLKENFESLFTAVLIVLVGIGGFGIGRMSLNDTDTGEARILSATVSNAIDRTTGQEYTPDFEVPTLKAGGEVVASKSGTKYHLPWCSGAKTIKEENKIWFASFEEARAAGYTPAGNCKGIE